VGSPGVGIVGLGAAVPERVVSNRELERMVDTSDQWIVERTGIRCRHLAGPGETASSLALRASREALEAAGTDPGEIDLVMVATITPDRPFPATACLLQQELGARRAAAFDLQAACSGFIYGLSVAREFVARGTYRRVLVVGVDILSRIVDWRDRSTCVLMGDGAGAAVVAPVPEGYGFLGLHLGANGEGAPLLFLPAGGSLHPPTLGTVASGMHHLRMNGREVFRFAVRVMGDAASRALEAAGLGFSDVDLYVPHQANYRIIEASARLFGIPMDKVMVNIDRYGNTSAASVPLALYEAEKEGRIERGKVVLAVAFGAGLTWGAVVLRWY